MLNGRQLRVKFTEFNTRYFSDRLPSYAIRVVPHIKKNINAVDAYGVCRKKRKRIEILAGLSDEEAISTLIHEMAHARTTDHHGMRWEAGDDPTPGSGRTAHGAGHGNQP